MAEKMKKFFWKLWMVANHLTKDDDTDFIAEVSTVNDTATNADIARMIRDNGSELEYQTILSVVEQYDTMVLKVIQGGRSVINNNFRVSPRVRGNWYGQKPTPDYNVHKATVDLVPTNKFRDALSEVGFEVLGPKTNVALISFVTDTFTGLGSGAITPNEDIKIVGDKIKVADNGTNDPNVGIFFVNEAGTSFKVDRRLTENNPKSIIARVPALPPDKYTLTIATYFSSGNEPLKNIRTITYNLQLTVS